MRFWIWIGVVLLLSPHEPSRRGPERGLERGEPPGIGCSSNVRLIPGQVPPYELECQDYCLSEGDCEVFDNPDWGRTCGCDGLPLCCDVFLDTTPSAHGPCGNGLCPPPKGACTLKSRIEETGILYWAVCSPAKPPGD